MVGCPEKQIREYCKQRKIRKAKKTPGGQWRVPKPLSREARAFLQREAFRIDGTWPVDGKEFHGDLEPEFTASLTLAHLLGRDWDKLYDTEIDESALSGEQKEALEKIERLIDQAETEGARKLIAKRKGEKFSGHAILERFWDLQLHGFVKQFWLKNGYRPKVLDISKVMGISRSEFARRGLSSKKIKQAYRIVVNEFLSVAAEAGDYDAILRANKAKKRGFEQLRKDYDPQTSDFARPKSRRRK